MGFGDDLMVCGEAKRDRALRHGEKVMCLSKGRKIKRSPIFKVCPDMTMLPLDPHIATDNRPGNRPYIDYKKSTPHRWAWRPYTPYPAEILINKIPHGKILIEPHLKSCAPPMKQWGQWESLLDMGLDLIQCGPAGTRVLPGVDFIETPTIIEAMRVVKGARFCILPEGGMHHACAAFGIPAIVLYGPYITPHQTGYDGQIPLWTNCPHLQGWRVAIRGMRKGWKAITPEVVYESVLELQHAMSQGRIPSRQRAPLGPDDVPRDEKIRDIA